MNAGIFSAVGDVPAALKGIRHNLHLGLHRALRQLRRYS
jgi:hypothetical protein